MEMTLRAERTADIDAIDALITAAFLEAARSSGTEQHIVKALRVSGQLAVSLVAEVQGQLAGHVAASPVRISDGTPGWFGIGPVSVLPQYQRRGIGTRLMQECLQYLRATGAAGCVLLGSPAYYHRFGFRPAPGLTLADVPPEYFLALPFQARIPRGDVTYDAAFSVTA